MTSSTSFDDRYDEPDRLRDQLRQLLRYRTTLVVSLVLGLLGGLLLTQLREGSYTSTSDVLVRSTTDPFSTYGVSVDNQVSMTTERQIAISATVAARAATVLHQPSRADALLRNLRVTSPPNSQVLRFEYTAGTPTRAARVTRAFADAYLADRSDRAKATVKRMTGQLEQQLAAVTEQRPAKDDEAANAARRDQITALQKRIADIKSYDTAGGEIVRRAEPPTRPAGPGPLWLLALGLMGGLLGGFVLTWLRSAVEPRVRSVGEVEGALGAPVLGILPSPARKGELLEVGRGGGSRAEAYRTIAFRMRHGEGLPAGGTLLVVSPKRDRNAEAAAVNLAAAFAAFGDDVLLVDATASIPFLSARLPLAAVSVADGQASGALEGRVLVDAGTAGRFTLLPDRRGTGDDLPASATVNGALTRTGSGTSALVVTRALLEHPDGLGIAQRADGVLVVAGDHTRRDDLKRVRELISCSGGRIVGAVLDTGKRGSKLRRTEDNSGLRILNQLGSPAAPAMAPERVGELPVQHADGVARQEAPSQPGPGSSVQDDTLTASR